jgi:hypothetical protein
VRIAFECDYPNNMQKMIYVFLVFLFSHLFLVEEGVLPNSAKWGLELFSIWMIPVILIHIAIKKRFSARPVYPYLFLVIFLLVIVSALINHSNASTIILGIRHHFKYLPFFLLPLVYDFSEKEIRKILLLLCGFCLVQLPVTILQRFFLYSQEISGDHVAGTVGGSGVVSIILVSAISILYALFLKKHISRLWLMILSACIFFPTTINETKVTFFILPLGLMLSTLLFGDKNILLKLKKIAGYCIVTILFAGIFVFVYNNMYAEKEGHGKFFDQLAWETENRGYLYLGEERAEERIEAGIQIGRGDTIVLALKNISKDIGHLFFGVGIGNALDTKIGFLKTPQKKILKYFPDMTAITNIIWEMGLMGIIVEMTFFLFIFQDAMAMRRQDDIIGAFCLGWCSVVVIMALTMFYLNIFYTDPLNITFWLLSGIVVSKRRQLEAVN